MGIKKMIVSNPYEAPSSWCGYAFSAKDHLKIRSSLLLLVPQFTLIEVREESGSSKNGIIGP